MTDTLGSILINNNSNGIARMIIVGFYSMTILFIIIIAMCFIPPLQPYVDRGFEVLSTTPDWFQWAMYASIAASFGLRGIKGLKK